MDRPFTRGTSRTSPGGPPPESPGGPSPDRPGGTPPSRPGTESGRPSPSRSSSSSVCSSPSSAPSSSAPSSSGLSSPSRHSSGTSSPSAMSAAQSISSSSWKSMRFTSRFGEPLVSSTVPDCADPVSRFAMREGPAPGSACSMRAAMPATCGAAMDVPDSVADAPVLVCHVDVIPLPGANRSTQPPKFE